MKLELLLVLAAATLLPDLSESKIFSICELRNKLQTAIPNIGQVELAKIVCEVKNMSNLNSSLVVVEGNRQSTSTQQPMTTPRATYGTEEPAGGNATGPTTSPADYDNTTAFTSTASVNASEPVSANSSAPSGSSRHKRSPSERKPKSEKEEEDEEEEEEEEDSIKINTWSLGRYGIFQLNDKVFCDSGYRWSINRCHTNCSAFTDDDITDDIKCFVGQKYWIRVLEHVSKSCRNSANTFFNHC